MIKRKFPGNRFWINQTWGHAIWHNARAQAAGGVDHSIRQAGDKRLWLVSYGGFGDPTLKAKIPKRCEAFARSAMRHYKIAPIIA